MNIWTVDAFTNRPFAGNPAAVMIVPEFSDKMAQIAAEMNLSETAFVKVLGQNHFHIRWLTPTVEVKLCGHATLAAAHILYQEGIATGDEITLESLSGPLRVYRQDPYLVLDFPRQKCDRKLDPDAFKDCLPGVEIAEVWGALDDIVVVLDNSQHVRDLVPNLTKMLDTDTRGVIVTAPGDQGYDFISRFFGPAVGVPEDPVTGSAHCKLGDYWSRRLGKHALKAYQASQRGGEILLEVREDRVHLKGQAVTVLKAQWQFDPL